MTYVLHIMLLMIIMIFNNLLDQSEANTGSLVYIAEFYRDFLLFFHT